MEFTKLDDARTAKEIYSLIQLAVAPNKTRANQKLLNEQLRANPWIKDNIITKYSDSNNPANIGTDFQQGLNNQYYPNANRLVFRGKNIQGDLRYQTININDAIRNY